MEKTSHSVKHNPSVKEVRKQPLFDLNQLPLMDDVPQPPPPPPPTLPPPPQPQPHSRANLCVPNEDIMKLKPKYEVLNPPSMIQPDYYKNLGFVNGYNTLMFVSDKKAKFPGRSLHALARSWFKEGVRKQDKRVSEDLHEETCHRTDVEEVEGCLNKPVDDTEVADILIVLSTGELMTVEKRILSTPSSVGMMTRSKVKTVEKRVLSTSAPCSKRRKYAPKMRRLNDIPSECDQK